jgi:hypothetical protein
MLVQKPRVAKAERKMLGKDVALYLPIDVGGKTFGLDVTVRVFNNGEAKIKNLNVDKDRQDGTAVKRQNN